jgi:hypothetical protein
VDIGTTERLTLAVLFAQPAGGQCTPSTFFPIPGELQALEQRVDLHPVDRHLLAPSRIPP